VARDFEAMVDNAILQAVRHAATNQVVEGTSDSQILLASAMKLEEDVSALISDSAIKIQTVAETDLAANTTVSSTNTAEIRAPTYDATKIASLPV
jgi:hypothetical protein